MHSILLKDALIVSQNAAREVSRGNILIEGNRIKAVGDTKDSADEEIDASAKIAMPGMINTHAHVAMAHLKGFLDDIPLNQFLERTFKLDSERTDKGLYNSTLVGSLEMIDSGITSFHDLYYSEDTIAKATQKTGIRAFLSWNTLDEEYTTQKGSPLANARRFVETHRDLDLVTPSIGVQGVYVSSDENYRGAKEAAGDLGTTLHTHLSETRKEVYEFTASHDGERPAEHLHKIGFLGPEVIAAHSAFVNMREVRLMAGDGTKVSWNALSNCKLGTGGLPPIPEMLSNGMTVSLGTDSNGSNNSLNMFECMKYSTLLMKSARWDPSILNAQTMLDFATINAAESLHASDLGSIEPGKLADLVLLESRDPNLFPVGIQDAVSKIVYSANPLNVDTVIVNGKILKRDKRTLMGVPALEPHDLV